MSFNLNKSDKSLIISFKQFPDVEILILLFSNVRNSSEIKENLLSSNSSYNYSFINPKNLLNLEQLFSSIYKTLINYKNNEVKSKTLNSEFIFQLSPNKNIFDSIKRFGIAQDLKDLIVLKALNIEEKEIDKTDHSQPNSLQDHYKHILEIVDGDLIEPNDENISKITDLDLIRKNYKLGKEISTDKQILLKELIGVIQLKGY
ncbi:Cgi121p [Ascoidea rubescens DSM 1968]|uniref:EKC/KEOPS complex subunit CGI121 n=1 Tax=Ascoidea rubescens DSM 1968 TaxID=1344418 RepID=A0A1D2VFF3_9ASCO|nr:CGI-121-domain-containing protein [Ascoidea rubescens DSM 1968]ODV60391.1 CGI-121-domain-containing protein [Ascoidea rubescens DSM 1968]